MYRILMDANQMEELLVEYRAGVLHVSFERLEGGEMAYAFVGEVQSILSAEEKG